MSTTERVYVGGIGYDVLAEVPDVDGGRLLMIRRPRGIKEYVARRLPDHPLYGEARAVMVFAIPRPEGCGHGVRASPPLAPASLR